jgi:hypothetical protein
MRCSVTEPVDGKWSKCGHPEGYHQWIAENPWVLRLQMPEKKKPEEDTESEKDIGNNSLGSYPPSEDDDE